MAKKGSLVVAGSGIKSVGHLTLETQGWIKRSDIVIYCVADPATEVWVKKNSRSSFDLYTLYGNEKKRIDTYNDMTQAIVDSVRSGRDTCALFYGHPGVFVLPTHKAISILLSEGFNAVMLPGISAVDCLWADLGIDPSTVGSQAYEATDLLLRERTILADGHVVIWQIGCIGDLGFNFAGYDSKNLDLLSDYLMRFYPPEHLVTHYQGAQYPMCPSSIEVFSLQALRNAIVTGISTLYIPPYEKKPTSRPMGIRLGLLKPEPDEEAALRASAMPLDVTASKAIVAAAVSMQSAAVNVPTIVHGAVVRALNTNTALALPMPSEKEVPVHAPSEAALKAAHIATTAAKDSGLLAQAAHARERMLESIRSRRVSAIAQYMPTLSDNALADYIAEMMIDPCVLADFLVDPQQRADTRPGLTPVQRRALASRHGGRIRLAMKEAPSEIVTAVPTAASEKTTDLC